MTGRAGTPPGPEGPRGVRIVPIDPGRPGSLGAWFAPIAASGRADWPAEPGWALHERAALLAQPGVMTHLLAIAAEGRETLGSSQVRLPLREDTATADIEVWVAPAHRGRGIGRALLGHAERVAYEHGRRIVSGSTDVPLGSPEAARRAAFARAAGYAPVLDEERHALALPVDPGLLDSLESAARPHAEGYRFAGWAGRCPARSCRSHSPRVPARARGRARRATAG